MVLLACSKIDLSRPARGAGFRAVAGKAKSIEVNTVAALERSVRHMIDVFGERYPNGSDYLARLEALKMADPLDEAALEALRSEALLAHPEMQFEKLLLVRRRYGASLTLNYHCYVGLGKAKCEQELVALSPPRPGGVPWAKRRAPRRWLPRALGSAHHANRLLALLTPTAWRAVWC